MAKKTAVTKNEKAAAAAQRAAILRAQQEANEKRARIAILVGALFLVAVVVAVVVLIVKNDTKSAEAQSKKATEELQNSADKPANVFEDGSVLLTKNGVSSEEVAGAVRVDQYFDFMCPGCGQYHRNTDDAWNALIADGTINMYWHPLNILGANYSPGDNYSQKIAGAFYWVVDQDPEHAVAFEESLYAEDHQPKEGSGYKKVEDDVIIGWAKAAGVREDVADQVLNGKFNDYAKNIGTLVANDSNNYYSSTKDKSQDGKGYFVTPTMKVAKKLVESSSLSNAQQIQAVIAKAKAGTL